MTTQKDLIPLNDMLEIADQVARRHRRRSHPDFDDLVQEILIGILERQREYKTDIGNPRSFIIAIANYRAKDRVSQWDTQRIRSTTNHRSRVEIRVKPRDAEEGDAKGHLLRDDDSLLRARFRSLLDPVSLQIYELLRQGQSLSMIERKTGISQEQIMKKIEAMKNFHKK